MAFTPEHASLGGLAAAESMTREQRVLRAKLAAHERWAGTEDPSAATAPARKAFRDRFEKQVDPDGTLEPQVRARRAEHARKAFYTRLALKSAQARAARKATPRSNEAA